MNRRLPPLLAQDLKVVFVGTEPGEESLRRGMYYANPRNSFWGDLHAVGLTPTQLDPSDFRRCLQLGIGLDDVYDDPEGLRGRIIRARPRRACFNSKGALERFVGESVDIPWSGKDSSRWASIDDVAVWALHDSSPRSMSYRVQRLRQLRALVRTLEEPGSD